MNTAVVICKDDGVGHYIHSQPTRSMHGRTVCMELWDRGPCVNINGLYVHPMFETNKPATCLLCLMEAEG